MASPFRVLGFPPRLVWSLPYHTCTDNARLVWFWATSRRSPHNLEIRDAQTHAVVTAIEMLSPSNKTPGEGREAHEEKRRQVLSTLTNFVEIDLLRGGKPMEMQPLPQGDYRILVRAGWERPQARLYACSVRQGLPEVSVPLRRGEPEARLPLGTLLTDIYARAHYDLRLDYRQLPEPLLSPRDAAWADALLRTKGLRS